MSINEKNTSPTESGINIPIIPKVDWGNYYAGPTSSHIKQSKPAGDTGYMLSHYHGLASVPYDGYTARLHKNERVLTAQEAQAYNENKGGVGIVVNVSGVVINNEMDVDDFAYRLAQGIAREAM